MYKVSENNFEERAVLVGIAFKKEELKKTQEYLLEMELLSKSAGVVVVKSIIQMRKDIDSSFYIGKGKINELVDIIKDTSSNVVIFDDNLSSGQVKNIQEILKVKVIDRTNLILDIFARNARTKRAKIQVELAFLQYMLPKLTSAWPHLGQQKGGIGTRGPGETQLEKDKRTVQKRISDLKKKLKKINKVELEQSKNRKKFKKVCLIGYTNAGKSSLINTLTKVSVKEENALFSTLDTTTRKLYLAKSGVVLVSDTVGFIRKLPHHLVESFNSTLNVIKDADLLVHVIDSSNGDYENHINVVNDTLEHLGASQIPSIMIFNKIDLCKEEGSALLKISRKYPDAFMISVKNNNGLSKIRTTIDEMLTLSWGGGEGGI